MHVAYSSSGDFVYIRNKRDYEFMDEAIRSQIIKDDIEVSSTSYRYIESAHGSILAIDGSLYETIIGDQWIHLRLTKLKEGVVEVEHSVKIRSLFHIPPSYSRECQAFLLLGKTDEDCMRVLLIPYIATGCASGEDSSAYLG